MFRADSCSWVQRMHPFCAHGDLLGATLSCFKGWSVHYGKCDCTSGTLNTDITGRSKCVLGIPMSMFRESLVGGMDFFLFQVGRTQTPALFSPLITEGELTPTSCPPPVQSLGTLKSRGVFYAGCMPLWGLGCVQPQSMTFPCFPLAGFHAGMVGSARMKMALLVISPASAWLALLVPAARIT